jgi:hypothetical protein
LRLDSVDLHALADISREPIERLIDADTPVYAPRFERMFTLGCVVFDWSARVYVLTEYGKSVLANARYWGAT